MPEGDTIHKIAAALREALTGREVQRLELRGQGRVERVRGRRVEEVAALGKHLLVQLGPLEVLHVHLGLHGSWRRYREGERWGPRAQAGERWGPRAQAAVVLATEGAVDVCFRASRAELIPRSELVRHPQLSRLGPDLLGPEPDWARLLERGRAFSLAEPGRTGPSAADLLLDQRVACGIGNVYKCELLFLGGLDPRAPASSLDEACLRRLYGEARRLLQGNLGGWPRTTVGELPPVPGPRQLPRLWVYGRAGERCLRCGSAIRVERGGEPERPTYSCPGCQATRA